MKLNVCGNLKLCVSVIKSKEYSNNNMEYNKFINIDALNGFKSLDENSIDCIVTSPPYWGLRDYGTAEWTGGEKDCDHVADKSKTKKFRNPEFNKNRASRENTKIKGYYYNDICKKCGAKKIDLQLGLEKDFNEYINKLCDIFDESKRPLKNDGSLWVNLGDTYSTQSGNMGSPNFIHPKYGAAKDSMNFKQPKTNLPDKCLCQIPSRFSIEMCNRGWILRNIIIWHKKNCMPTSVKDRFTVDFEYLFFFVQNKKYYFEQQFDKTDKNWNSSKLIKNTGDYKNAITQTGGKSRPNKNQTGRNKRTTWTINPKPFKEAHFAVYPEELILTPIKACCPRGGIVCDPFSGSGTTAKVSLDLDRKFIAFEINKEYIKISENRVQHILEQGKLF